MSKTRMAFLRFLSLALMISIALTSSGDPTHPRREEFCRSATTVPLNHVERIMTGADEPRRFQVEVPSPGLLMLEVTAAPEAPQPALAPTGDVCGEASEKASGLRSLERSAARWTIASSRQGFQNFQVLSADPRQQLTAYKLQTAFLPRLMHKGGEDPEEIEPEPEGLAVPLKNERRLQIPDTVCSTLLEDDHSDVFHCATSVRPGEIWAGQIHNPWGDDVDFFRLVLEGSDSDLWRIEVTTTGDLDTFGALYDASGRRLGEDDDNGRGRNFRIARALTPGIYYVRIEGRWWMEGNYSLHLNGSAW